MRYLRLYKEHSEIPDYFIDLDSIGYVLDPETGLMYPKWKRGGYDHENSYQVDYDSEITGIAEDELKQVNKFWKSCRETVGDKVNWSMIEMAKDLSFEYLDEGMCLVIQVLVNEEKDINQLQEFDPSYNQVYIEEFSHNESKNYKKWNRYFPKKMNVIESGLLEYRFTLKYVKTDQSISNLQMYNSEFKSDLSKMFPGEVII